VDQTKFFTASRIIIVAGKGGVGKTTVSAGLAMAAAQAGLHVLFIELDDKPSAEKILGSASSRGSGSPGYGNWGYEPTEIALPSGTGHITARRITATSALTDYLDTRPLGKVSRKLITAGIVELIATAAPGIDDLLVLGKIKALESEGVADLIIIDGPPAGQAISLLMSARALNTSISGGPIHQQSAEVLELLADSARCQVMLVTLPETTPVNEMIDTAFALEDDIGVHLAPLVINAVESGTTLEIPKSLPSASGVVQAARFQNARTARQSHEIARLKERLAIPTLELPFLTTIDAATVAAAILHQIEMMP